MNSLDEKMILSEQLRLYMDLFTFSPTGYLSLDHSGKILEINLAASRILEQDPPMLTGTNFRECLQSGSRYAFDQFLDAMITSNCKISCEVSIQLQPEKLHHFRLEGVALPAQEKCLTMLIDITEQKKTEELLNLNESRLETLFDLAADAILVGNPEGIIIKANQHAFELTGYQSKELLGQSISILFSEQEQRRIPLQYEQLKAGMIIRKERLLLTRAGKEIPVEMNTKMMPDGVYQTIIRDMTERKKFEDALKASEKKFSEAFKTSPDSININRASDGVYIEINDGFCRTTGYRPEEVLGKSSREEGLGLWVNGSDRDFMVEQLKTHGEVIGMEAPFRMKDGSVRHGLISARFIEINGETCILSTTRDITERKRNEEALIASRKKAEESEKLKSAFLANMSHEIRSPMNSIVGFSELIEDDDLPAEQRHEFISIIRNSGRQLLTIINDIIDFAKIESNQLSINPTEINLNRLLDDIVLASSVEKKKLSKDLVELKVEKAFPNEDCTLICDEVRLKQILINLTGNALKFTNKGFIKTGYRVEGEFIIFYVQDTGKGIAKDKQDIIFERFRQEEESYTRLYGGTGLGLSISKGLVELLGGKIWLESDPGVGATFLFSIPITTWTGYKAPVVNEPVKSSSVYDFTGKKILVVEDIDANFRLLNYMLSKTNATVFHAENGMEAIEACRRAPDIDVILMDIQMPEMDGYEATREIRKFNSRVPVIALTAFTSPGDSVYCQTAGCTDYLTKPVEKKPMLEMVKKYLDTAGI